MMSITRIERLVDAGHWRNLIESVLANGRLASRDVVERLCASDGGESAALGLALLRCCELSYGPCPLTASIARRLRRRQAAGGAFGNQPAATAIALRGLLEFKSLGGEPTVGLQDAIDRGVAALREILVGGRFVGDRLDTATIAGWLGSRPELRSALPSDALDGGVPANPTPAPRPERPARAAA